MMKPANHAAWKPLRRRAAGALLAALAAALAGCDRDVVAAAGKTKVTREEFRAYLARRGGARAEPRAALDEIADRALLAEAGRRQGLRDDPAIRARLAATEREILAQAYLDRALATSDREDVLRQRYAAERERLARRRVHVAQIVFRVPAGEGGEGIARSRVTRAYARIVGGEPFEKVAKEVSEDAVSAARGGDLGSILEGQVDPSLFDQAAALAAGEVSKPIRSAFGFHLLKAVEAPDTVVPSFDEARGRLAAEAREEGERALFERLRSEIGVTLHPERLPAASGGGKGAPGGRQGEGS